LRTVLHPIDWRQILLTKDGQGRYIVGDPIGQGPQTLWNLPVVVTLAIGQGTFLCGAFARGAQVFDRLEAEVLVSTEDGTNFQNNLVTIRGEERLPMTVRRPTAFVTGSLPA
jgi:HK97 family phage major capsid protein